VVSEPVDLPGEIVELEIRSGLRLPVLGAEAARCRKQENEEQGEDERDPQGEAPDGTMFFLSHGITI
jgi:hypothetical protein